ncbi:hypothetical protein RAD15_31760 [Bradyrhizobium sp. 14AA]
MANLSNVAQKQPSTTSLPRVDRPGERCKLQELQDRLVSLADDKQELADVPRRSSCRTAGPIIMQWSAPPTASQREIFNTAGSVGNLLETAQLRGQIARSLHKQKTDANGN